MIFKKHKITNPVCAESGKHAFAALVFVCIAILSAPQAAQAQDLAPPPAAPSGPAAAQAEAEPPVVLGDEQGEAAAESALPDGGALEARSPGLSLPVESSLMPGDMPGAAPAGVVIPQKTDEEMAAEIRDEAFNAALTGLLPLEPNEIRRVIKRYDQTQEAAETPIYPYPEPEVVVKNISLDPGTMPPLIKVAAGHVTTINIVDVSGAPWPIQDITWAGNFEIVQPEEGGHVVRITPMSEFAYGNMSVRLVELDTPITFILRTHRDGVFYRADMRLPIYGPNATPPIIEGGLTIAAGDPTMTAVLDGVPPEKVVKLEVAGADGRTTAFKLGDTTYVRTPLTLLSPAWKGAVKSADGMNVYMLGNAPVLLLSDQGRVIHARLSEKDTDE